MTLERRTNDRRRRVLFSTQASHTFAGQEASEEEHDRHRAARRPQEAYGSRVKRRLRSRWFSLIPIHRSGLLVLIGISLGLSLLLCLGHYYSANSDFLLNHSEIARPLKLDQPSSFGQFLLLCFTVCSTGAALMIYQLRRYRNDDFAGHYRIWRIVIFALILHGIHLTVDLLAWSGAIINATVGQRILISGEDWARLLVDIGGLTIAVRLFMEVRINAYASSTALAAAIFLSFAEFSIWQPGAISSTGTWLLATSSKLLGLNSLFISLLIFLRQTYREVRELDAIEASARPESLEGRFELDQSSNQDKDAHSTSKPRGSRIQKPHTSTRWKSPIHLLNRLFKSFVPQGSAKRTASEEQPSESETTGSERRHKSELKATEKLSQTKKRIWFSKRSRESVVKPKETQSETPAAEQAEPEVQEVISTPAKKHPRATKVVAGSSDEIADPESDESIDWNSMSKSERRRLRKQLKRQKRAA